MRPRRLFILAICFLLLILVPVGLFIDSRAKRPTANPTPADDTPEGAAIDYQMALIEEDYDRALGALSLSLADRPRSSEDLYNDLKVNGQLPEWDLNPCIYVEKVSVNEFVATVTLREQFYDPCTGVQVENLSFGYIHTQLRLENGAWKIIDADEHFAPCWSDETKCE